MRRPVLVTVLATVLLVVGAQPVPAGDPAEFETLVAPDARGGDRFGFTIALDGNRLVVGAPNDRLPISKLGSVWVFTRYGLGWHTEKITPSETWRKGGGAIALGRRFGFDLDVVGDRIVVGAPNAWINGIETGGVFVYDYIDDEWIETILVPEGFDNADGIGYQVDLSDDGNRILAGSWKSVPGYHRPGKVFLWEQVDGEWVSHMFEPSDGEPFDRFGATVGFGDGFFAVGSPGHGAAGREAGAVYIYEQFGDEWVETKIVSDEPAADDRFGSYINVWGDLIGVQVEGSGELIFVGRTDDGWSQESLDLDESEEVGAEQVEDSGIPVVGDILYRAVFGDSHPAYDQGAVRVMERTADEWVEIDSFDGADFGTGNGFGFAIIPLPDTLFISAPWWKFEGETSGVVFVRGMPPVCGDWEPTILGTNGDDEIYGTPGDDVILPGTGDDIIHSSGGQDVYCLEDGEYRFVGPIGGTRSGPEGMEILITTVPTPKWRGPEMD